MKLVFTFVVTLFHVYAYGQYIISEKGDSLAVQAGTINLPENRKNSTKSTITLSYQIAKSTDPESHLAVFLLAGGPGGSWLNTAKLAERFQEVKLYQKLADVVIFDQRGAGRSVPNLDCKDIIKVQKIKKLNPESIRTAKRELAIQCRDHFISQGIDLSAYNTVESTHDIEDLRKHLNYERIILVGGSYGSHLGLSYLRNYPENVACAIFHGLEGPDHTLDMPSHVLNTLKRIAATTEASPYYNRQLKGQSLLASHQTYLDQLKGTKKEATERLVAAFILRFRAGDRNDLSQWPNNLLALYEGKTDFSKQVEAHLRKISAPHAMNNMMDFSSWATPARIEQIKNDQATDLVGNINHSFFAKEDVWPATDLGDIFRSPLLSDKRVLLIHGSWDMSTPLENALEVKAGLPQAHLIEVEYGSHGAYYELLEEWNLMEQTLSSFIQNTADELPASVSLSLEFPEVFADTQIKFWDAVLKGDTTSAGNALKAGADVNLIDTRTKKTGRTAMNWAAWHGDVEMMQFLLRHGAEINIQNKSGFTPIHHAIENCQVKGFEFLLEQGADLTISSFKGVLPKETAHKACPEITARIN